MTKKITNSIPVVYRHLKHLECAVDSILTQTLLPSEIIIIISEYSQNESSDDLLKKIENRIKQKNIKVIIKTFSEKQYAGENREIAYNLCTADVIIFQDCDDIAHKQRNEILLKVHESTKSPHILHGWTADVNAQFRYIDINNLKISHKINKGGINTHNGAIFIDKSFHGNIEFPNLMKGQDLNLTNQLLTSNSILIENNDIYIYRNDLSSWG